MNAVKAFAVLVVIVLLFLGATAVDRLFGAYVGVIGVVVWIVWAVGMAYGGFDEDDYKN